MLRIILMVLLLVSAPSFAAAPGPGRGYAQIAPQAFSVVAEEAELRAITLPLIGLVRSDPKNLWLAKLPQLAAGGVKVTRMRILADAH